MREREGRRFALDFLGYRARCFPRDGDPQENHPSWIGYPSISAIPWTGLWGKCCCPVSLFLRVSTSLEKRGTPFSSVYILLSRRLFSRALSELSLCPPRRPAWRLTSNLRLTCARETSKSARIVTPCGQHPARAIIRANFPRRGGESQNRGARESRATPSSRIFRGMSSSENRPRHRRRFE